MERHTDDPRMVAILSRMKRRRVDVSNPEAVILALEEEIDTYRESIRILRENHKPKPDRPCLVSKDCEDGCTGYQAGRSSGYSAGFEKGVLMMTHRVISELASQPELTGSELVKILLRASLDVCKGGTDG